MTEPVRLPYLIQRFNRRRTPSDNQTGFDKLFDLHYMGSSEFEWGAIPAALRAMRAAKNKNWKVRRITIGQHVCFYVGDPARFGLATMVFQDQLLPHGTRVGRTKDSSRILESYNPDPQWPERATGWWSIDEGMEFILCKYEADAADILGLL